MSDQDVKPQGNQKAIERAEMLERIANQNEKSDMEYRRDMSLSTPIEAKTDDVVALEAEKEAAKLAESDTSIDKTSDDVVVAPKATVMAKIDGEEIEVEIEHLVNSYQKNRHAEKEMEKAALARKEVALKEKELNIRQQDLLDMYEKKVKELEQGQAQFAKQAEKIPASVDSTKKAVSDLFGGNEEQATQSLDEAINAKVQVELERRFREEATKIQSQAEKAMEEKFAKASAEQRWHVAITQAQSNNPDLFKDEDLASLWEHKLRSAAQSGSSPEESVAKASQAMERFTRKDAVETKSGFKASDAELAAAEVNKAQAKKFAVDSKSSAVLAGKQQEEDREPTQAEIVAQMNAFRNRVKQNNR